MALNPLLGRIRKPVRRRGAETYVLVTLLSFAASVGATRLFLELTGYPQIAAGEIHIAHVLWGGLLLFSASLVVLIFANRWVYMLASALAGAGVGLFIDEVGKFVTQSNNYFHPLAAPIIYSFFLITVLIYLRVRQRPAFDARGELYLVLSELSEVLDHDLEPDEQAELKARLSVIVEDDRSDNYSGLAQSLLVFLQSGDLQIAPERAGLLERMVDRLRRWEARWLPLRRMLAMLIGGLVALGLLALADFSDLLLALGDSIRLERMIGVLLEVGSVSSSTGVFWFAARVTVEGMVGLLLLLSGLMLLLGMQRPGINLGVIALLLSLAGVDVLVFYFEQFSTILTAAVQFLLLLGLLRYRRRAARIPSSPKLPAGA
jgi:hypothetical protein